MRKLLMILSAWFLFNEIKAGDFPKTSLFEMGFGTKKMTTDQLSDRSYFKLGVNFLSIKKYDQNFLVGTELMYNSAKFIKMPEKTEKFFGGGVFVRYFYESDFLSHLPIVVGLDGGLSKEFYFSGGIGFLVGQKIELMVNFDFFDNQTQPTLGMTIGIKTQ